MSLERARSAMIDTLVSRGIRDERVLEAMRIIPRHLFVDRKARDQAYADHPLPIGFEQTISQPYIVAMTLEALELQGDERVLEIGTGSAYQAALLGLLAHEVYTVEVIAELAEGAAYLLDRVGLENVIVVRGDGSLGFGPRAPYQAIAVAAASPSIPEPLFEQLAEGGRLVVPVGNMERQELLRVKKIDGQAKIETLASCVFVPLVGSRSAKPW
jgi:protein-L-isoaspartate(D-aspartate) O-methyltransferase